MISIWLPLLTGAVLGLLFGPAVLRWLIKHKYLIRERRENEGEEKLDDKLKRVQINPKWKIPNP